MEGMMEGRKDGRMEGRTEGGRKERGMMEGRKEGEWREEGGTEGREQERKNSNRWRRRGKRGRKQRNADGASVDERMPRHKFSIARVTFLSRFLVSYD